MLGLIADAPAFVPERLSLDGLLETFHERRTQMVFLVDEYGGVEGLVTLQDVVDELLRRPGRVRRPPAFSIPRDDDPAVARRYSRAGA